MSGKEDTNAHVLRDSRGTSVKSHYGDHVKTSWSSTKWISVASTTFQTNTTNYSQSSAALVPSLVPHGRWSSLTHWTTLQISDLNRSSYTTCRETKMSLNGTTTACQCRVWSPSKMFQLTGEPLAIFPRMALTIEITYACHWKPWICLRNRPTIMMEGSVFWPSLLTSVGTHVSTAQSWLDTARTLASIWTAAMVQTMVVISVEEYRTKTLFGYYFTQNSAFRCTSVPSSTTQYWLESF